MAEVAEIPRETVATIKEAEVVSDVGQLSVEFSRFVREHQQILHGYKFPLHDLGPLPPYRRHKR